MCNLFLERKEEGGGKQGEREWRGGRREERKEGQWDSYMYRRYLHMGTYCRKMKLQWNLPE